jgi:hypothetical protein
MREIYHGGTNSISHHPRRNQIVAVHRICQVVLGSLFALYLAPCKFRLGLFLVGNRLSGPFFVIKMRRNLPSFG